QYARQRPPSPARLQPSRTPRSTGGTSISSTPTGAALKITPSFSPYRNPPSRPVSSRYSLSRGISSLRSQPMSPFRVLRRITSGLLVTALLLPAVALAAERPNIVFIFADDLGWTDLGCQGSKYYETPNIDRLAAEGMRFTDGYTTSPNCQPTRAAIMSGQY